MEVTRYNFQEVMSELDEVFKTASFLAIDGEFTGLTTTPESSAYDTPSQFYSKMRTGSMNFLLVQFGLTVFTYNQETENYIQRSYNFYVFPRPYDRSSPDCRFLCQASSLIFLANQGFDFNKLFQDGIPYLTKEEEAKLYEKLEEKYKLKQEGNDLITISEDDKPHVDEICKRINEFIGSEAQSLIIGKCNGYMRRIIYQESRIRWPEHVRLESRNENGNQFLVVHRMGTKEEEEQLEADRRKKELLEVRQAVGMSVLLRKIAATKLLIVGHNMLFDICHIIHQFFTPLPENYFEFKDLVHNLFPKLIDTKILSQASELKDSIPSSILNQLLETLQSEPFSIPEIEDTKDRSYSLDDERLHEAGFDAYVTGLCFLTLIKRLGVLHKPEITKVFPDSPILNFYLNKLLITRLKDFPYINLAGKDPNPSRDHVFHITFPREWKLNDLIQIFAPFGGAFISWLSDTTAFAALNRRDQVSAVVQKLFQSTDYTLKRYKEFQAKEQESSAKPERKRKISDRVTSAKDVEPSEPEKIQEDTNSTTPTTQNEDGWEVASGKRRRKRNRNHTSTDNEENHTSDTMRKTFAENNTWE